MSDLPKYTMTEAMEAKRELVSAIEFAFFTALADLTDLKVVVDVGPVDGGGMAPHSARHQLIEALVDRLLYDDHLVIYPVAPDNEGNK